MSFVYESFDCLRKLKESVNRNFLLHNVSFLIDALFSCFFTHHITWGSIFFLACLNILLLPLAGAIVGFDLAQKGLPFGLALINLDLPFTALVSVVVLKL